jgi:hypothetical protein
MNVYKKGACAEGTKCLLLIVASDVDEEVSFVFCLSTFANV